MRLLFEQPCDSLLHFIIRAKMSVARSRVMQQVQNWFGIEVTDLFQPNTPWVHWVEQPMKLHIFRLQSRNEWAEKTDTDANSVPNGDGVQVIQDGYRPMPIADVVLCIVALSVEVVMLYNSGRVKKVFQYNTYYLSHILYSRKQIFSWKYVILLIIT